MKITPLVLVMAVALSASPAAAQAPDFSMKGQYAKPTPEVRSFGQLLGHIANATGMICTIPAGGKSPLAGDAEKLTTKAELTKASADAFAACDKVWAAVTPAWQTEMVDVFGAQQTKMAGLTFNTSHIFEHYGNVVTYLRLKGIVPPSSGGI